MQKYFWTSEKNRNHANCIPDSFRMLIVGRSGCGKTSLLMRLLLEPHLLDYNKLFIFGRSLHQKEYQILKAGFENSLTKELIIQILKHNDMINDLEDDPANVCKAFSMELDDEDKGDISIEMYEKGADVPDPNLFDSKDKNLIVFDDIMCDKNQSAADNFYTRGRHNNVDSIYISQNFYKLPRQTIRSNANFMIFFKLSPVDVNHVFYDSDASVDFKDISEFKDFCNKAWQNKYGYIVIDKDKQDLKQRYRTQLELEKEPTFRMKVPEDPVVIEKSVTSKEKSTKPRASKKCEMCDIEMLSSSHSKHTKSKSHLKKTSIKQDNNK